MAQHDQVIDNGPGLAVRTDINAAFAAIFSSSSGTVEPTKKVAGQLWFNSSTGRLQVRNAANTAWEAVSKYMGGTVTLDSPVAFAGASTAVGNALVGVQDSRVTTGAEGNSVFAVNRQNSTTPALMFGNDANSAGLIGSNNATTRIGKWVSGVFTSYLNIGTNGVVTIDGTLNIAEGGQTVIIGTNTTAGIEVQASAPSIKLTDTTASAHDFWMHVDSNNFYVLVDRDNSGSYEAPYPLQLEGDTNNGYLFGSQILTAANYDGLGVTPESRTVTAGNGLTGGGALSANITLAVGTPGSITNSTTNSVTADSHTHALGFTAAEVYAGTGAADTNFPVGHTIMMDDTTAIALNGLVVPRLAGDTTLYVESGTGTALAGTWRVRGAFTSNGRGTLAQRVA